jgi:hypothetical protein
MVRELSGVEERMLEHTRNAAAADTKGELTEIRASTSVLMSQLRLYQSYSAFQGAYGQMLTTLGVDPLPDSVADADLATLTEAIRAQQRGP